MLRALFFLWTFMLFTIPITDTQAQGIRKKINGVLRKTKTEINRTNRDVKRIKKTLSPKKKTINPALDTADVVKWQKEPYIPNSGMINKYQHVFSFLHKEQELSFANDPDSRSIIWDSLNNIFYKNSSNDQKLDEDVEVMGWHPHWLGDAYKYYNYNLLSIISYYSYDIDPTTGENWQPDIIDQLRNSSLPDSAAANGVRAFISVTSLTEQNNKEFLSNEAAQYHFTGEILKLLNEKKGKFSGIDLNFEEIRPEDKEKFTNFVKVLSAKLKTEKYSLILDVPFIDQRGVYEFAELQEHVEYFNIMGYDFNGEFSPYPGSVAPLHGLKNQPSLETAVNDILLTGVLAKNVILTLPLYGVTWDVTNIDRGEVAYFDSSIPHYDIVAEFGTKYDPYYDPFSVSYFYYTQE